jgi:hypothetical protein
VHVFPDVIIITIIIILINDQITSYFFGLISPIGVEIRAQQSAPAQFPTEEYPRLDVLLRGGKDL